MLSATAALWAEVPALIRGPASHRVVWDIPREDLAEQAPAES